MGHLQAQMVGANVVFLLRIAYLFSLHHGEISLTFSGLFNDSMGMDHVIAGPLVNIKRWDRYQARPLFSLEAIGDGVWAVSYTHLCWIVRKHPLVSICICAKCSPGWYL